MAAAHGDGDHHVQLARAAREGDRAAWASLYEVYRPLVHGILLSRIRRDDVDDLVQDVFVAALKGVGALRDSERFGAWLAEIARKTATAWHRRRYRRKEPAMQPLETVGEPLATDADEHAAERRQQALEVLEVIRSLPVAYREVLVLRLVEGMTGPEIAQRTGLTPGSVRINLYRGMKLLKGRLGLAGETGDGTGGSA